MRHRDNLPGVEGGLPLQLAFDSHKKAGVCPNPTVVCRVRYECANWSLEIGVCPCEFGTTNRPVSLKFPSHASDSRRGPSPLVFATNVHHPRAMMSARGVSANERQGLLSAGSTGPSGSTQKSWLPKFLSSAVSGEKTPLWLTACNFMNGVVGAGVIGIPGAINEAGFGFGIALCLLVAMLSAWTVRLLGSVGREHQVYNYPDLCQRAFGDFGFYGVCIFQALFAFGAMCSYLIIYCDTVSGTIRQMTDWESTHPALLDRRVILAVGALLVLFPLCLLRRFASLARFSVIKLAALLFLTFTVIAYQSRLGAEVITPKSDAWKYSSVHPNFLPALGTIAFAFVCHHQTFLVMGSLADPTPRRFAITVNLAMAGSALVTLLVGVYGYTTFWDTTKGDILLNYEAFASVRGEPVMVTSRLLMALNMLITYPSEMMVARGTIEMVVSRWRRSMRWRSAGMPVHDRALLAQLAAADTLDKLRTADAWQWGTWPNRALWEHVGITSAVLLASTGVSLGVTDLSKVLGITGAFTAVFLAFVLPAAIRLRLGPRPDDDTPLCHVSNLTAWIVLLFGAVAFVASTGFSVVAAATGQDVLPVGPIT